MPTNPLNLGNTDWTDPATGMGYSSTTPQPGWIPTSVWNSPQGVAYGNPNAGGGGGTNPSGGGGYSYSGGSSGGSTWQPTVVNQPAGQGTATIMGMPNQTSNPLMNQSTMSISNLDPAEQQNVMSIIEKIAAMGLKPSEYLSNLMGAKGSKNSMTAEQFATTKLGQRLGGATLIGSAVAAGMGASQIIAWLAGGGLAYQTGKILHPGSWTNPLGETVIAEINVNSATTRIAAQHAAKFFSPKLMAAAGAYIGAVTLGLWGQAETQEPINMVTQKYLIPYAQETGDWSLVNEANAMSKELGTLSLWEKLGMATPAAAFIGISNKIKGNAYASKVLAEVTGLLKQMPQQQSFLDEYSQFIELKKTAEEEDKQKDIDYQKAMNKMYEDARLAARDTEMGWRAEDEAYWTNIFAEQETREAEKRQYWADVQKQWVKLKEENQKSKLSWGLL